MSLAHERLTAERKKWRADPPIGFHARPSKKSDGSIDIYKWDCGIPGPKGTPWEGSVYPITMEFSSDYPQKPPKCQFQAGFYHPNIYPSGTVCLSILNEETDWRPGITVKEILLGIKDLLANPNPEDPAQASALKDFNQDLQKYEENVKAQALKYKPTL